MKNHLFKVNRKKMNHTATLRTKLKFLKHKQTIEGLTI